MTSSLSSKQALIKKKIKKIAVNSRISCPALRKLAEESGVTYKNAGTAADDLTIKIKNCDLGCF